MKACIRIAQIFGIALLSGIAALPAIAQDNNSRYAAKGTKLTVSLGHSRISVNELVFGDTGDGLLSHLRWNAETPVITFSAKHDMANNWTLSGSMTLNIEGDADLVNRDWLDFDGSGPFIPGSGYDDWTHYSEHSDSDLLRYIDIDVALGRDFKLNETTQVNLHGGLKYNLVELEAHGGSYVYSRNSFRDDRGNFQDGLPIITYQQWHRAIFAGAEVLHDQGHWQFSGLLRGGVSLQPRDVDNHWLRKNGQGLRFDESFESAPFAQIRLGVERQLDNGLSVFANANYQKYFEKRGDAFVSEISSGLPVQFLDDAVGADMSATTFSVGISRDF